jgi:hypothetical protein
LEDHKLSLVQFLDTHVVDKVLDITGYTPQTEEEKTVKQEARNARYEQIKHEPHQTWVSEFASRIMAILPIYAVHTVTAGEYNAIKTIGGRAAGMDYVNPSKSVGFAGFSHYLEGAGEKLGEAALKIAPESYKAFGTKERFNQHAQWLASDSCYTWLSATLTYAGTRILAPILGKKEIAEEPNTDINTPNRMGKINERIYELTPA